VVILLIAALGGYFFIYPRLRGGDVERTTNGQPAETSPASAPAATGTSSDSSTPAASAWESESASSSPTTDRGSETTAEMPAANAGETTSVGQVRADNLGRSSERPSPVKTKQSRVDAPLSQVPEPVSSPPVSAADQGQATSPAEPTPVETAAEASDRSPAPSPEEAETSQASAERPAPVRETPAYEGPKKGVVIWTGEADKGMTIVIEGASASSGQVQGSLPGVACMVRLAAANVAVTEGPGPRNGYRRISLRFNRKGRFSVPVEWEVLH